MDAEIQKAIDEATKAHRKVSRLYAVGGGELRKAKAERAAAEAKFEALCAAREAAEDAA